MPPLAIDQLSAQERLALITQLWDSLDDTDVTLTPAQAAELDRRLAARDGEGVQATPWPEVRRALHERRR